MHDRVKHKKTKANDTGFHSANSNQEIEDGLTDKMVMAFKELAVATKETINLAVGNKPKPPTAETDDLRAHSSSAH